MSPPANEEHFDKIAGIELSIEKTRARAERAAKALAESGADPHLIEALERTQDDLSAAARALRQGTYFAVPDSQTRIQAA